MGVNSVMTVNCYSLVGRGVIMANLSMLEAHAKTGEYMLEIYVCNCKNPSRMF